MTDTSSLDRLLNGLRRGTIDRRTFVAAGLKAGAGVGLLGLVLEACGGKRPPARAGGDLGPIEDRLNIYIWSDYLADRTVPDFEREFNVKVVVDTYESNEDMVAKLLAGASGYDVVVPSSYVFPVLFANDLVAPLNRKYLTNWDNVAPLFRDPVWDRGNEHSVPYQWGMTGIAWRRDRVAQAPDSWEIFLDPTYAGKMTMLDDLRDVIGAFLTYRGHSLNSVDPSELAQARTDAIAAKANLRAFISATVKGQLITGDVWISQLWNGDAAQARAEQPAIEFALPKEGSMIFVDAMVLPRTADHPRAAHEFMNYVLRPEVAARIADKTGYGTPNHAAVPLTKAKMAYPSDEELARLEYQRDLGRDTALWDRIWTEIKASD